jgi:prepilin-type N-terminal cleavage/methylation domain-containing protein
MKHLSTKGFTLVELLVVISIIALLAGIVIASLSGAKASTRDARRLADIKNYELAIRLYYQNNGEYPPCSTYIDFQCLQTALAPFMGAQAQDPQYPAKQYYYDNWCNTPAVVGAQQYRLWAASETDQDGLQYNWWSDNFIGATTCTDPS